MQVILSFTDSCGLQQKKHVKNIKYIAVESANIGDLMAMGWHKLAVIFSNHRTNLCALKHQHYII